MRIEESLLKTPLWEWHRRANGRMVPFAGWELPVYYAGVNQEVEAVRERAGIFDVSHMGRLRLQHPDIASLLQHLTVNDVARLEPEAGQYSLMLNDRGGVLDDLLIFQNSSEEYLLVVNASNREKIVGWIRSHSTPDLRLDDETLSTGLAALQGPQAIEIGRILGLEVVPERFGMTTANLAGIRCTVTRTGYTGEDGLEIMAPADGMLPVWEAAVAAGASPCGLGSRDTLRLEAAYCLYGHEIDEETTPLEARLNWVVRWQKGEFLGREALARQREEGPRRVLVGFEMEERSVPRPDQEILVEGVPTGRVTSGTFSPSLEKSIGLGFLPPELAESGADVTVGGGTRPRRGKLVPLPFYRSPSLAKG